MFLQTHSLGYTDVGAVMWLMKAKRNWCLRARNIKAGEMGGLRVACWTKRESLPLEVRAYSIGKARLVLYGCVYLSVGGCGGILMR